MQNNRMYRPNINKILLFYT